MKQTFEKTQYDNPDSFYWPVYYWFWNDPVTEENITAQLDMMKKQGAGGVYALGVPKEHRPVSNPTNLKPTYLSKEYMRIHQFYVREAKKRGMKVWLYDDSGWPSGSICGRIVQEHPELAHQYIERQEISPYYDDYFQVPKDCLGAFLFQGDKFIQKLNPGKREQVNGTWGSWPTSEVRIEIYWSKMRRERAILSPPKPDLLNPKTVQIFLRLTHEQHKKWIGDEFGDAIPVIVSDEMSQGHNPLWTEGLAEAFKRDMGYDLLEKLPSIFHGESDEDLIVRIDFHDWCTKRFASSIEEIRNWCRANGMMYAGHLGVENDTLSPYKYGLHLMRSLRSHDLPGTDAIYRQIFPFSKATIEQETQATHAAGIAEIRTPNHYYAKYTSSVAHQEGRRWCFTESFGVYGSGLTIEQMKWVLDFQYVRGMNLTVLSAVYLAAHSHYMAVNTRPMFDDKNPVTAHIRVFNEYMARLSYLLSLGEPEIDTAVYYPIRDIFAGGRNLERVKQSHELLVQKLLEKQCDFDLVDEDILDRAIVKNGVLEAGHMKYKKVYVSFCRWMKESSKQKLSAMNDGGGKTIWVDGEETNNISFDELEREIEPVIRVEPENPMIRVCKRKTETGNLYFVTNEDTDGGAECQVTFEETLPISQLDVETSAVFTPKGATQTDKAWKVNLHLPISGSAVFFFSENTLESTPEPDTPREEIKAITRGWTVQKVREYRIGEEEIEVVERAWSEGQPVSLGEWRESLGEDFSGQGEYRVTFVCSEEEAKKISHLDLGTVKHASEVTLNGENLGKRLWQPFTYPVGRKIKEGTNEIRVVVTNTLANQYATSQVFEKWPKEMCEMYQKPALFFEKQSMDSGLFGPVRLLG